MWSAGGKGSSRAVGVWRGLAALSTYLSLRALGGLSRLRDTAESGQSAVPASLSSWPSRRHHLPPEAP